MPRWTLHSTPELTCAYSTFIWHVIVMSSLFVFLIVQILREAMRTSPSIVYLPHLSEWWQVITEPVRASFVSMFNDLDPSVPVLLLATSDIEHKRLYPQVILLISVYFHFRSALVAVVFSIFIVVESLQSALGLCELVHVDYVGTLQHCSRLLCLLHF